MRNQHPSRRGLDASCRLDDPTDRSRARQLASFPYIDVRICVIALAIACLTALLAVTIAPHDARAGEASSSGEAEKVEKEKPAPALIPLAQLAAEADAASASMRKLAADRNLTQQLASIAADLPTLTRDVEVRWRENRGVLTQRPSLDVLRDMDGRWQDVHGRLTNISQRLARSIDLLDQDLERTSTIEKTWLASAAAAKEQNAPPELLRRADVLLNDIASTRKRIEADRSDALKLQARISELDTRVNEALQANRKAREATVGRMLTRDSPAFWDDEWRQHAGTRIRTGIGDSLEAQISILESYFGTHAGRLTLHASLLVALSLLFYWVRLRLRTLVAAEPELGRAAMVVEYPIASALVLALMLTHWIYPQPPRLVWAITGIAIFVPTVIVLRRLVTPALLAPLYAVLAFYFVDQARSVSASIEVLPRAIFVAEMIAATGFLFWLRADCRLHPEQHSNRRMARLMRAVATIAMVACAGSTLANIFGYVALSNLVGDAVLHSLYAGLVLYTVVQILDALLEIALRVPPLTALRMVQKHRNLFQRRLRKAMQWAAAAIWASYVLDQIAMRDRALDAVKAMLNASVHIGRIEISISDVLAFVLAVWAAFLVSRLVRFVLDEEVFPHTPLKRGIPYAISRTIHFAVIAVGFVIAMGVIGMEMTQFTILASAFTIGVGFGLQNIFNNFVSGLIVLFERPVQVGDVIQIDDAMGVVSRIGIRASVVRTASGSEVIVPNGKLISERVVNWTLSGRQRIIDVPISVVLQSDPQQVIDVLQAIAEKHPSVLKSPRPEAIVTRMGPDWMGFELRVAIVDVERWMTIRSELAIAAAVALREANVALR